MEAPQTQGVIALVARLGKLIHRQCSEELLGMTLRSFVVLGILNERGAMPQQELGEMMCLDANGTVLLLHELEDDELIVRRRDPADRRRHIIEVTAAGRAAFERAELARNSVEDAVFVGLSPQERETLRVLMAKALAGGPPLAHARAAASASPAAAA